MVRVSTSWPSPDPRGGQALAPPRGLPYALTAVARPAVRDDILAGLVTLVVTVLAAAPVGLLWAALAPRADVVVEGGGVQLAQQGGLGVFIAADGSFLLAGLLAGAVSGVFAWRLGRAHGPAVVLALTVGGLLAAYLAVRVGQQVGVEALERAIAEDPRRMLELPVRLRAREALVGWPVGALLAYVGASFVSGR